MSICRATCRPSATLRFANLDVNPFLPEGMRNQVTRQASLDGEAHLTGPLKQPRLLHANLSIQQFSVEVEHIPIKSDGPIELSLANETVTVQRCAMISQENRLTLTGTASFAGRSPLEPERRRLAQPETGGNRQSRPHLLWLRQHQCQSRRHRVSSAAWQDEWKWFMPALSMIDLPAGLGDVNGTLVFNQRPA